MPGSSSRDIMRALDEVLPGDTDIVVDAAAPVLTAVAAVHHPPTRPGTVRRRAGHGWMGYSFGAAVGVACARGKRTVVIAGTARSTCTDWNCTAIQHRLPITYIAAGTTMHAMCARTALLRERALATTDSVPAAFRPPVWPRCSPGCPATDDEPGRLPAGPDLGAVAPGPAVVSIECSTDEIHRSPFLVALDPGPATHHGPGEDHAHVPASASRYRHPSREHLIPSRGLTRIETSPKDRDTCLLG